MFEIHLSIAESDPAMNTKQTKSHPQAEDAKHPPLLRLTKGEGFTYDYSRALPDSNALRVLLKHFDPTGIAIVREKYHRSTVNFEDLQTNLFEYDCSKAERHHTDAYYMVLQSVYEDLFIPQVTPTTRNAVINNPNIPGSKSPGLPDKNRGYKSKREAVEDEEVIKEIDDAWTRVSNGQRVQFPDVAVFARAQITTRDKNKVQATWGYPLPVYLEEGAFFYPLLEQLTKLPNPIFGYGIEMGTGGMEYIDALAQSVSSKAFLLGDWSGFDNTVPPWLVRDCFCILESFIDFEHVEHSDGRVTSTNKKRHIRQWRKLIDYFINTPCRLSNGERFIKNGGIPSGTCFTNLIDSMANGIVM